SGQAERYRLVVRHRRALRRRGTPDRSEAAVRVPRQPGESSLIQTSRLAGRRDSSRCPSETAAMMRGLLIVALVLSSALLHAQTETATISGRITDPQGGVVVDAEIRATNIDTNISATTQTNASGVYVISHLLPGVYRLTVTSPGF